MINGEGEADWEILGDVFDDRLDGGVVILTEDKSLVGVC